MDTAPAAVIRNGRGAGQRAKAVGLMNTAGITWYKGHNNPPDLRYIVLLLPECGDIFSREGEKTMVKNIIHDTMLLMRKSSPAGRADIQTATDLSDTLRFHEKQCAGMAANMIGVCRNIIAVNMAGIPVVMMNPEIISHSAEAYECEEGCLSLEGVRKTKRWRSIELIYEDIAGKRCKNTYSGFIAQVIQHEIDHCNGVLI